MNKININDFVSDLDSNRFGFLIAKLQKYEDRIDEILKFLKNNSVKLVLTKLPCENIDLINLYEENGFLIKDIQVTYKFDLGNFDKLKFKYDNEIILRDAKSDDLNQLKKIAQKSFYNYGHYAADQKLDIYKCNQIYIDWVTRSLLENKVADKFIVAEIQNEVAGFLTFKLMNVNGIKYVAGGIGAVSEKFRNKSIFKIISSEGLRWAKNSNLNWVEHNVLITNYPVNRAFLDQGFKIYKSFVTMHNWIK